MPFSDRNNDFKLLWGAWQLSDLVANGPLGSVFKAVRKDKGGEKTAIVRIISLPSEEAAAQVATNAHEMCALNMATGLVGYEDYLVVDEGKQWYVILRMQLLEPMKPYFNSRPFSVEEIARLGIEICAGLEQADKRGIFHGDIKESDLFMDEKGGFRLGDFSLARMLLGPKGASEYPTHIAPRLSKAKRAISDPIFIHSDWCSIGC